MFSPIVSSVSYPAVSVAVTHRMNQEDRIDLMRFLFMGPTKTVSYGDQEDIGAVDDWLEGDSELSVPELIADLLDDSFLGLDIADQGKEAVEETVVGAQGEDRTDQGRDIPFTEEVQGPRVGGGEDAEDDEEEWALPQTQGAPSLTVKSLRLYRQLGEGGFGQVYAASLKGSDKVHAVKIIPKTEDNEDQASREQDLLRRLMECAFFPKLEASWQSNLNYYLVTVCVFSLLHPTHILLTRRPRLSLSRYILETFEMKSTNLVASPSTSLISISNRFWGPSITFNRSTSFTGTSNSKISF